MISYKYDVVYSAKFKTSLKKILKQGKNIDELKDVIYKLAFKEKLDRKYRNHKLIDDKKYRNCFECHIRPDWILIYQYNDNELLLLLIDTGSHSEIL